MREEVVLSKLGHTWFTHPLVQCFSASLGTQLDCNWGHQEWWTPMKSLIKEAVHWEKFRAYLGLKPTTLRLNVLCSTEWAMMIKAPVLSLFFHPKKGLCILEKDYYWQAASGTVWDHYVEWYFLSWVWSSVHWTMLGAWWDADRDPHSD